MAASVDFYRSGPPIDLLLPHATDTRRRRSSSTANASGHSFLSQVLRKEIIKRMSLDIDDSFFVADLGEVYRQLVRWKHNLPRVEPFYAVKCNPDLKVLKLLQALGTGFDCASQSEIDLVQSLGVPTENIIYANPCKAASHLRFAKHRNVKMMTFDNADELYKVQRVYPEAHLLLRILTDDEKSLCRLGLKYGAPLHTTYGLLCLAKQLGLNVIGVSFHVGSGNDNDPAVFDDACVRARKVFDEALEVGFGDLQLLDIGGGFGHGNFDNIAHVLNHSIDKLFPPSVRVIAEPGRYFVSSAFTLAVNVIARRLSSDDVPPETAEEDVEKSVMYYVNDGVYGAFNCILFDHQQPIPQILSHKCKFLHKQSPMEHALVTDIVEKLADENGMVRCSIWGPTCDSLDCITRECALPCVLDIGDWLYFEDMGAYTTCASTYVTIV